MKRGWLPTQTLRRGAYRLGRAMYMLARGDIANDMASNGERYIQGQVIAAWQKRSVPDEKLVIFDIGANVGEWTLGLLQLLGDDAGDGKVEIFLFEPVPQTYHTLRSRLPPENGRLHTANMALSSSPGKAQIYVAGDNEGTNTLHRDQTLQATDSVEVPLSTATAFFRNQALRHVHLMKCDTEGHDMEVLRGALPLLRDEHISVLQFEYNHRWVFSRNFLRDVFLAAQNLPYTVVKLQGDHVLSFTEWVPELEKFFEGNYALVHRDALDWFEVKPAGFDRYNAMQAP